MGTALPYTRDSTPPFRDDEIKRWSPDMFILIGHCAVVAYLVMLQKTCWFQILHLQSHYRPTLKWPFKFNEDNHRYYEWKGLLWLLAIYSNFISNFNCFWDAAVNQWKSQLFILLSTLPPLEKPCKYFHDLFFTTDPDPWPTGWCK